MKMEVETYSTTILFSDLAESETYRENLDDGTVYMKLSTPIENKHNSRYNAVDIETGELNFTFEDSEVFPVNGTFVEGYKKK